MMAALEEKLRAVVASQPDPLLFATISGAHLYGFPSPDSDYDLRGVHVLPLCQVVGLEPLEETRQIGKIEEGLELDLVTHDIRKFFEMLLKRNGYVLEQLTSPLIVHTTPAHEELKHLAPSCLTCHHAYHYLGFAQTEWKLFDKERPRRVKPLLYIYRVLLTGIHLMESGEIEANLLHLNERFRLPYIQDLVARKLAGAEQSTLPEVDMDFHASEFARLVAQLEEAKQKSHLPDAPTCRAALNDLLIRVRLAGLGG